MVRLIRIKGRTANSMNIFRYIVLDAGAFFSAFTFVIFTGYLAINLIYDLVIDSLISGALALISFLFLIIRIFRTKDLVKNGVDVNAQINLIRHGYGGNNTVELSFEYLGNSLNRIITLSSAYINENMTVKLKVDPNNYRRYIILLPKD